MDQLQSTIEDAFERRADITPRNVEAKLKESVAQVLDMLDSGKLRVAEKIDGRWNTHQWIKKAVLFPFGSKTTASSRAVFPIISIKCPPNLRITAPRISATVAFAWCRPQPCAKAAFIASNVVLMPSYVNIGAYVDEGTMVDTWATVGSCAQIGKNVHLSGGVGIGGVLEPVQANPTIIEDNCFIGARSEIVEGVIVGENSVISMGVYIGQSTKIYNRETGEIKLWPNPAGIGSGFRQPAFRGWEIQPLLRDDC